jgi:MerR family transcriptional regulator, light-induced transcriptional regulator
LTISAINSNIYQEMEKFQMDETNLTSPLYNIGVVTRVTGVPIATLHAWERRYGFPNAERSAGGHRLYSEKDIARLRWVKSQVDSGLTVSRAVIAARSFEAEGRLFLFNEPENVTRVRSERPAAEPISRTNGFPSLRKPLLDALMNHDLLLADQLMGEMLAFYSPEDLILEVIGPALNAIGEEWENRHISVATEHLASNYLRHRLLMWLVTGPTPRPGNPIVLACAPGEWHEGSLLILGVLLRRQGWPVAYLGQNVPFHDLAKFVDEIHPRLVVLVAMGEESARTLATWPEYIHQLGGNPVITFGGRAFALQPDLQGMVPGIYLGDSIPDGLNNLDSILQNSK